MAEFRCVWFCLIATGYFKRKTRLPDTPGPIVWFLPTAGDGSLHPMIQNRILWASLCQYWKLMYLSSISSSPSRVLGRPLLFRCKQCQHMSATARSHGWGLSQNCGFPQVYSKKINGDDMITRDVMGCHQIPGLPHFETSHFMADGCAWAWACPASDAPMARPMPQCSVRRANVQRLGHFSPRQSGGLTICHRDAEKNNIPSASSNSMGHLQ